MVALLLRIFNYLIIFNITRVLTGIGLGLVTYGFIKTAVNTALSYVQPLLSALPATTLNLVALSGIPEALSIIGSAFLTAAFLRAITPSFAKK